MDNIALRYAHENDFDRFLFAEVGKDRNGNMVTVLSTLARMGLDPRQEAAELAALSRKKAGSRLASLLANFTDIPKLDHDAAATRLARLLPDLEYKSTERSAQPTLSNGTMLAILMILIVLAQILGFGIWN